MWSDINTFDILKFILMDHESNNLLVIATYRSNELQKEHPLLVWQKGLEENPLVSESAQAVTLTNLNFERTQELLSRAVHLEVDEVRDLAQLLLERTDGNIFFLIQLLEKLQDSKVLFYDITRFQWALSIEGIIRHTTLSDNLGELVCSRIQNLPTDVQETLKLISCFGSRVDTDILEITKLASNEPIEDIMACVEFACKERMLIQISSSQYKFYHDQIQSAAFSLLPAGNELVLTRWKISGLLLAHPLVLEDERLMFACADQVQHALEFVQNEKDRVQIAELTLKAGIHAARMSAFLQASAFLGVGVKVIGGYDAFVVHYDLAVQLFAFLSKISFCLGHHDYSKEIAETLLKYSKTFADKISPLMTIFQCLLSDTDPQSTLQFGLDLSETLGGEKIPRNPTTMQALQERRRLKSALKEFEDEDILGLPRIVDRNIERSLSVLVRLIDVCHHEKQNLLAEIIQIRCVLMTLHFGLSKWSTQALVAAAQHSIGKDHDVKEGARFARLAEKMLYLCPSGAAHSSVCIITGVVDTSRRHLDLCMQGYRLCMGSGDIEVAGISLAIYFWAYFYSGLPFSPLLEDIERFAYQMLDYNQNFAFIHTLPIWQCLLNLSGKSKDPLDLENGEAIEKRNLIGAAGSKLGTEAPKSYGMQVAFLLGDIDKATMLYHQVVEFKPSLLLLSTAIYLARVFFFGLICIANVKRGKKKYKAEARKHMMYIRELVESGSMNLVHKLQILEAEYKSLDAASSGVHDLLRNYDMALVSSTKSGFIQDAALCAYLAAKYCASHPELKDYLDMYLVSAHDKFLTWGASAVADSIRSRHPHSFEAQDVSPVGDVSSKSSGLQSRTRFRPSIVAKHQSLTPK